jgi:hypothetical protein
MVRIFPSHQPQPGIAHDQTQKSKEAGASKSKSQFSLRGSSLTQVKNAMLDLGRPSKKAFNRDNRLYQATKAELPYLDHKAQEISQQVSTQLAAKMAEAKTKDLVLYQQTIENAYAVLVGQARDKLAKVYAGSPDRQGMKEGLREIGEAAKAMGCLGEDGKDGVFHANGEGADVMLTQAGTVLLSQEKAGHWKNSGKLKEAKNFNDLLKLITSPDQQTINRVSWLRSTQKPLLKALDGTMDRTHDGKVSMLRNDKPKGEAPEWKPYIWQQSPLEFQQALDQIIAKHRKHIAGAQKN